MNNQQWDDYIRQTPGTFWGEMGREHDWSRHFKNNTPVTPPPHARNRSDAVAYPHGTHTSSRTARPGLLDEFVKLSDWITEHVPPIKYTIEFGKHIMAVKWRVRLPLAGVGALLLVTLIAGDAPAWAWGQAVLQGLIGANALLAGFAIGAVAGWFVPSLVGFSIACCAALISLALALSIVAGILGVIYVAIAAMADWPPFAT